MYIYIYVYIHVMYLKSSNITVRQDYSLEIIKMKISN